jgi:hypothetical protein
MKNNKNPLYIIIAVLTTAAMVVGIVGCSESVLEVEGPVETVSYEDAERAFISGGMTGYSVVAGMMKNSIQASGRATLTLTPESYLATLMMNPDIKSLNTTTIDMDVAVNGGEMYCGISYKNGSKQELHMDYWLDSNRMIMSLPAIIDKYLTVDMGDGYGYAGVYNLYTLFFPGIGFDMPNLPSEAALKSVVDAVLNEYFTLVEDREVQKNIRTEINGIQVTVDKKVIDFTEKDMMQLGLAALKAIEKNNEIKKFIQDFYDVVTPDYDAWYGEEPWYDPADYAFDFEEILAEGIAELQEDLADADTDVIGTMIVYIRGASIIMREIIAEGETYCYETWESVENVTTTTITNFDRENSYYFEFSVVDVNSTFRVTDSGTKSGGARTGKATFEQKSRWDDNDFSVDYQDIVITDGNVTGGNVTIEIADLFEGQRGKLELTFRKDEFVGGLFLGGIKLATATLTWDESVNVGINIPAVNRNNSIDANDDSDELEDKFGEFMEDFGKNGIDLLGLYIINQWENYLSWSNYEWKCFYCDEDCDWGCEYWVDDNFYSNYGDVGFDFAD